MQNLCFLKTRRRTKSPPLPGGISKNDPVAAAGKRLSILLLHEAKKWFHIIRWKPPPSQHCFCRRFSHATSLSGCLPPSPSTLLGKSVEAECTGSFCSSCWKKLTYYSFSASNGFYWLTALTIFFSSSLARWNWQCLESYSAPEFGQFNFFLSLKWIVSQCGFWTVRVGKNNETVQRMAVISILWGSASVRGWALSTLWSSQFSSKISFTAVSKSYDVTAVYCVTLCHCTEPHSLD